jgi:uncharacterized protein YndB with AHSA1/START domain
MQPTNSAVGDTADREISTTREFNAPRDLVWEVWTDPEHYKHWWGPDGFSLTTKTFDLRPGGSWNFTMHGPDGTDYRNDLIYAVVDPKDRLEWSHGPSPHFDVTVLFEDIGEKRTRLQMRMLFPTVEERNRTVEKFNAVEGQRQTMNRLEAYLKQAQSE